MCLGIPGKVLEVFENDGLPMGKVEFGGIVKQACLSFTPEAQVGDYVIVHVGFAISRIDEAEAHEIFSYLKQIGEAELPDEASPAADTSADRPAADAASGSLPQGAASPLSEATP
jgi:hydrogenase expression/formation protein HypC